MPGSTSNRRCGWCSSMKGSVPRSGRRSSPLRRNSDVRQRHYAGGCVEPRRSRRQGGFVRTPPRPFDRLGQRLIMRRPQQQPLATQTAASIAMRPATLYFRCPVVRSLGSTSENLIEPPPTYVIVVDDVVTTGLHFKAMKRILRQVFPNIPIVGYFVARRVPETIDIEAFFQNLGVNRH